MGPGSLLGKGRARDAEVVSDVLVHDLQDMFDLRIHPSRPNQLCDFISNCASSPEHKFRESNGIFFGFTALDG